MVLDTTSNLVVSPLRASAPTALSRASRCLLPLTLGSPVKAHSAHCALGRTRALLRSNSADSSPSFALSAKRSRRLGRMLAERDTCSRSSAAARQGAHRPLEASATGREPARQVFSQERGMKGEPAGRSFRRRPRIEHWGETRCEMRVDRPVERAEADGARPKARRSPSSDHLLNAARAVAGSITRKATTAPRPNETKSAPQPV